MGEVQGRWGSEVRTLSPLYAFCVFSVSLFHFTVTTSGCKETPVRLTDMGVPSYVVSAVLKGVISQRLVQKKGGGRTLKAEVMCFENADEVRALCGK